MAHSNDRNRGTHQGAFSRRFSRLAGFFWSNWLTSVGSMLLVVSAILILCFLGLHVYFAAMDRPANPYFDMVGFIVLPMFFLAGLALIVSGTIVHRKRSRLDGAVIPDPGLVGQALRRKATVFGVFSLLSLTILGIFSYEGYHYTDSTEFCSSVCHTVMQPEAEAYKGSPHAHVSCVSCHIGPGASWFVRSKLSGLRQVFAVLRDSYSRPIPTPVHNLRPARETCEVCHWPAKFHGSRLVIGEHYSPDRENTPYYNALVMKIGGTSRTGGAASGVHWHVDPENEVRYRYTDDKRHEIVEVVQRTVDGEIRYLREGAEPDDGTGVWRTMDCIDCHSRPTHVFEMPERAVDELLASGRVPGSIAFIKREAVRILRELEPDEQTRGRIAERLEAIYTEEHPEALPDLRESLPRIAELLAAVLERNIFPAMDVTWGTYTDHIGHMDADGEMTETGCFRCHDEMLESPEGEVIGQDCESCHAMLAWDEEDLASLPEFVTEFIAKP